MIQLVDNFYMNIIESVSNKQSEIDRFIKEKNYYYALTTKRNDKVIGEKLDITLNDYTNKKFPNNTFFSFFTDEEKKKHKNQNELIITIKKEGETYFAQTGNFVGKFVWKGLEIDIKSRFSIIFLERMLNFANDIFLDDVSITGKKVEENDIDISKYIIYYMFVQNLEKAFLLGLPKAYCSITNHEMKLKGKIDINQFINHDIPFQGKISSISREQKEVQEVIDVLYKAVNIIEKKEKSFLKNISHIKTHLKQNRSNQYVSSETINKALNSKALLNPIFLPYKKVLEYARFIINGNNIEEKKDGQYETYGFLINVSELFEIYITKLIQKEFISWNVNSPKISLYNNMFYERKIIPDIVMTRDKQVMVFDTKYKKMNMKGKLNGDDEGDVDRNDFFQINNYMSYYHSHPDKYNLKVGGLLYPMNKFEKERCHSETWFENNDTHFIIDGINLSGNIEPNNDESKFSKIVEREMDFISNLKKFET